MKARRAGNGAPFASVEEVARRAGVGRRALEALAAADAFGTVGSRRAALWEASGIERIGDLPLFGAADAGTSGGDGPLLPEPAMDLPPQRVGEEVVEDYTAMELRDSGEIYATYCFLTTTHTDGVSELRLHTYFGGFAVRDQMHFAAGHALFEYERQGVRRRFRAISHRTEALRSGSLRAPEIIRGLADGVWAAVPDAAEMYTAKLAELVKARTST